MRRLSFCFIFVGFFFLPLGLKAHKPCNSTLQRSYHLLENTLAKKDRAHPFFHRMNGQIRRNYKLEVREGLIFQGEEVFDTLARKDPYALWVMDEFGNFYAYSKLRHDISHLPRAIINHASFLDGARVAGAGTIVVKEGRLVDFTNDSGHYLPGKIHLLQAVERWEELGLRARKRWSLVEPDLSSRQIYMTARFGSALGEPLLWGPP